MRQNEKQSMIELYTKQFNYYLLSGEQSESERLLLQGQKQMLQLFFTSKEINAIENNIRVTSKYKKDYFLNIESWLRQIEKEQGEKEILFSWNKEGIEKVYNHYDWLLEEYNGFKLALTNTFNVLNKAA
jgi:hypothetical protein